MRVTGTLEAPPGGPGRADVDLNGIAGPAGRRPYSWSKATAERGGRTSFMDSDSVIRSP
jgi:hypothetical protein